MWASTPTAQNGKRGDFSPDPHVLSNTLCRSGRPCPPSKFVEFSWLFVGADAHIGPLKCCEFALDFHKTGQFRRADRVVRPYGAKSKINTVSPENRHKTGASCGSMRRPQARFEAQPRNARLLAPRWASTPTLRNGKRGDFSPDPHVLSNTLCRGGRLCPPLRRKMANRHAFGGSDERAAADEHDLPQLRKAVSLAAGDEHLPRADLIEHKILPLCVELR